jgi:hypothetical protein
MPKIQVTQPFVLRVGKTRTVFTPGIHEIGTEELEHWFLKGCLAEGRAFLLQPEGPCPPDPPSPHRAEPGCVLPPETAEAPQKADKLEKTSGETAEEEGKGMPPAAGGTDSLQTSPSLPPVGTGETDPLTNGVMSPDDLKPGDEVVVPGREDYEALTVAQLSEIAAKSGVSVPLRAKKSDIIDLLMAGETHAGKTLVVADNGDLVEKD